MQHTNITTVERPVPYAITKITRKISSDAHLPHTYTEYETKKTIIKISQFVRYFIGLLEVLLLFRFGLKVLGANPFVPFTSIIYSLTNPLIVPFAGIVATGKVGNAIFESSTLIAAIVYLCLAWAVVYLLGLMYPITSKDIEKQ